MPSSRLVATASVLASGHARDRPRVSVLATEATADAAGRPRWRLEIDVDRGDGRVTREVVTLPADVVALVGRALGEVGRALDANATPGARRRTDRCATRAW